MSEKRFTYGRKNDLNFGYCPHCIRDLQEDKIFTDYTEIADLLNKQSDEIGNLKSENEWLKKKITPSIYNKKDGDWKWNVDNNTILNINTGEIFYLRNSGAVENLVGLLNILHQENQQLQKKVKDWKFINDFQEKEIDGLKELLKESIDYWKAKDDERTETFTTPPKCDECDYLGNNGICGYCKFTLNCYDRKEDLTDGEVLPNCPLKPLINEIQDSYDANGTLEAEIIKLRNDLTTVHRKNKELQTLLSILSKENEQLKEKLKEYQEYNELGGDYNGR